MTNRSHFAQERAVGSLLWTERVYWELLASERHRNEDGKLS